MIKISEGQTREALRAVATTAGLGKQSAIDILAEHGGGAPNFLKLKPKFYAPVFVACAKAVFEFRALARVVEHENDNTIAGVKIGPNGYPVSKRGPFFGVTNTGAIIKLDTDRLVAAIVAASTFRKEVHKLIDEVFDGVA